MSTQVGRLTDAHSYEGGDLQYPEASTKLDGGLGSGKGTEASWGRRWGVDGPSMELGASSAESRGVLRVRVAQTKQS